MDQTDITIDKVGQAIADRKWGLRFPPAIEARFEADTGDARCRLLIRHNYVGIAIYDAFLLGDWYLVHDIFAASLALHLLVMTPIMGLVVALLARRPAAALRESVLAGGIVLGTMAILGLMLYSRSPLRTSEHISVVLVILFATMVQRIRFPYVVIAGVMSLVLYLAALAPFALHEPARIAVADAVFCGVVLFSLIGCYNLEREQRTGYLFALRDQLRNEELETLSRRDALTGAGNRRALDHALAERDPETLTALLLCDIDHFKAYNDANGHMAGDVCLRRMAELIGFGLPENSVFRFGGEEFLVLLRATSLSDALTCAEQIRARVEADRGTTLSIGVAVGFGQDLIAEADRGLYAAKRAGRNCVRSAPAFVKAGIRSEAA